MGPFHPMMGPFYSSEAPPQVGSFRVVCTGSGISIVLIQYISMKLLHIQLISPTTVRIFIFSPSSSSHTRQFYKSLLPHSPDWLYTLLISISCSLYYFSCILIPWVRLKAHSDSAWYCVSATHMSTWYRTASRYLANTCGNTAYPQNVCKYLQENVQIYVIYNGTVQKCMALHGLLCTAAAKVRNCLHYSRCVRFLRTTVCRIIWCHRQCEHSNIFSYVQHTPDTHGSVC